jgi:AcrR family transcriptional regulator
VTSIRKKTIRKEATTALPKPARRDLKSEIGMLKRESILSAAAELFAARGYHNVSMEQLAEALGVTKPFVYAQFRDKNDLLFALCRRGAELSLSSVLSHDQNEPGRPIERFARFCRSLAEIIIDNRTFIAVYSHEEMNLTKEQRSEIAGMRAKIDRHVTRLINDAAAAGDANAIDPAITATAVGVMFSALWYWYREHGPEQRAHTIHSLTQLALRMIGAKASEIRNLRR